MNNIKVMVISNIEWSDQNAFGNTISNWFAGMSNIDLYSVYRRSALPSNGVCKNYYSISSFSILKHLFSPKLIGKELHGVFQAKINENEGVESEQSIINLIHRHNLKFFYLFDECLFRTRKWNNDKFKDYVRKANPDIIFSFLTASPQYIILCDAIKEIVPGCREVYHIADDVYEEANRQGKKIIEELVNRADILYGASEMLCRSYSKAFNKEIYPLYKGCRFQEDGNFFIEAKDCIEIVYAGNLKYGRDGTLTKLIEAIKAYNLINQTKLHISIYSSADIDEAQKRVFDDGIVADYPGVQPFEKIKRILKSADVVLHVESFDEKWKRVVRYSYSTKIVDCLESGSAFLAIGPKDVSSIMEASQIPGVMVATDESAISSILEKISKEEIDKRARLTHEYAVQNCGVEAIQKRLLNDFSNILNNK